MFFLIIIRFNKKLVMSMDLV